MTVVRLRITALLGGIALSALGTAAAGATTPAPLPTVGCDQIIGAVHSPTADGYRRVLGYVSAPPALIQRAIRVTGVAGWTYWMKAGMGVSSGRVPVIVSVPRTWRTRVAITWGNAGPGTVGVVSALRFAACPSSPVTWHGYAGGFYLRSPAACVPLTFTVGNRSSTVRFGIGRHCQ